MYYAFSISYLSVYKRGCMQNKQERPLSFPAGARSAARDCVRSRNGLCVVGDVCRYAGSRFSVRGPNVMLRLRSPRDALTSRTHGTYAHLYYTGSNYDCLLFGPCDPARGNRTTLPAAIPEGPARVFCGSDLPPAVPWAYARPAFRESIMP
jgi:hypothetical protein